MRYLETVDVPIDEPEDYPGNARVHDHDWLDDTVTPGQHRSLFVRRLPDGRLQMLGGHGTRNALRRKGHTTVRVEVFEATDAEAHTALLSDNPPPGVGGYDQPALLALLDAQREAGGLGGSGWTDDRYDDLVKLLEPPDLDALAGEIGEPTDEDGRVPMKVMVDPEVRDRFQYLMKQTEEREESDAVAGVLAWASAGARADGVDVEP